MGISSDVLRILPTIVEIVVLLALLVILAKRGKREFVASVIVATLIAAVIVTGGRFGYRKVVERVREREFAQALKTDEDKQALAMQNKEPVVITGETTVMSAFGTGPDGWWMTNKPNIVGVDATTKVIHPIWNGKATLCSQISVNEYPGKCWQVEVKLPK